MKTSRPLPLWLLLLLLVTFCGVAIVRAQSTLIPTGAVWKYVDDGTDRRFLPLVEAIREHTPPEAKLLLLIEHRGLYLPRNNVIGTPFFQEAIFTPPEEFATPDRVLEVLEQNQITHLVVAKSAVGPDRAPEWWERLSPLLRGIDECERQGRVRVVWESEQHVLFAVR